MDKTKETVGKFFGTVREKWTGIAPRTRTIILAVAGVVIVSAIILTVVLNSARYTTIYTASDAAEAREVVNLVSAMGQDKVKIASGNRVMVLDNAPISDIKMQLAMEGYPRDSSANFNYDIYNTGVNAFSTESDRQQMQVFQLQNFLMATLNAIPEVSSSTVILNVQNKQDYVLSENKIDSSAAVMLKLKPGKTLSKKQIDGVYNLTRAAVPGLKTENIAVTDASAIPLIASDDGSSGGEDLALEQQRYTMYTEFKKLYTELAYGQLDDLMKKAFKDYSLAVDVVMDYQNVTGESLVYTPVVGVDSGIVADVERKYSAGGTAAEGGAIGTTVNADLPTYPTVPDIAAGNDFYVEWLDKMNYKINEEHKKYADQGLRVGKVTASVIVDSVRMSDADVMQMRELIAGAIGAQADDVRFLAMPFPPTPARPEDGKLGGDNAARNLLIYIIICFGALLIILFTLAIMTSGSKKKRMVRYRGAAPVVDGAGTFYRSDMFQAAAEEQDGFDLPSLVDNDNETKDVVLKREIKEFSRSNPEIVAQLIRTWLRTDE